MLCTTALECVGVCYNTFLTFYIILINRSSNEVLQSFQENQQKTKYSLYILIFTHYVGYNIVLRCYVLGLFL